MPIEDAATFTIPFLRVLDEEGRVDADLDPGLARDEALRLYRAMVFAREADDRRLKLQRQGRIGTFAPSTGQEASTCGPAFAMTPRDWMVISFREAPAQWVRGVPLSRVFLYDAGFEEGNEVPEGARDLPLAVIVASQTLHAVGIGYAMKVRGETDSAVVTFVGDGGTSEGDFYEALNFAGVWQVPVVFVVQNNHWAISTPLDKQTRAQTLAQKAVAAGIPGVRVDGNDVLAMVRATREALDRARAGGGPTLIEAVTYRMRMHTTADDPRRYRGEAEVEAWKVRDPIVRFRAYLESRGWWDADREAAQVAEVRAEIDQAVREFEAEAERLLRERPDAAFEHVYASPPEAVRAQRAEFVRRVGAEAALGGRGHQTAPALHVVRAEG